MSIHLHLKLFIIIALFFTFKVNSYAINSPAIGVKEVMGLYELKDMPWLVDIEKLGIPVSRSGLLLEKDSALALKAAYNAFKKKYPTIPFVIISATRNYSYQNMIWNNKWKQRFMKFKSHDKTAKNILLYSSMPGTSRHHWGTDFDITSVEPKFFQNNPKGKILYAWLTKNMEKYGFCNPFSKGRKKGYQPEEWHWSYQPLASQYLKVYRSLLDTSSQTVLNEIHFMGSEKLPLKKLIEEYVFSINTSCY